MGFTQAAALLIIASQLPAVLGVETGWQQWLAAPHRHAASKAFGLISLALLVLARRWRPAFPSVLFIVAGMTAISAWAGFEASGGKVVGALPAGLPSLYLPGLPDWHTLGQLLLPTLVITLVSFLETASSAKVESQGEGQIWNQNQDLIGQGLAKIASGLSGAFPTSSSFSRSALNIYAGARTGWATVVSVAVADLFVRPDKSGPLADQALFGELVTVLPQSGPRLLEVHRQLLDALRRGDAAAAEGVARRHMQDYRRGCEVAGLDISQPIPPLG